MTHDTTPEEASLFNDTTQQAAVLWQKSKGLRGLSTDPKMFSVMLFRRLWSNHRGYVILSNNNLQLESDIVLRSGIEASICLAANHAMREAFVDLMHGDAIFTMKGQIKIHRVHGSMEMVRESEEVLRDLQSRFHGKGKPAQLNWQKLARRGNVSHLYSWHRMLSGLSSHVTGASVLTGVAPADDPDNPAAELASLQRKMHLMMMAGATLQGSLRHAGMLNDEEAARATVTLLSRLGDISGHWPGAEAPPETEDSSTPTPV